MRKAIAVGLAAFLVLIVVRIPAGVVQAFVPEDSRVKLLQPEGTVWRGIGQLLVDGRSTGYLGWSVRPVTFLKGRVGYDLSLSGAGAELDASLEAGLNATKGTASGTVEAAFVNQWLAPYLIEVAGAFDVTSVDFSLEGRSLTELAGRLTWEGGPIRYRLSGNLHDSVLPGMTADLGPGPAAVAYATGESTPLLHAALADNGFVRIGVTKYLTILLGQPWPGGDPDHAVVLEVEEQLF